MTTLLSSPSIMAMKSTSLTLTSKMNLVLKVESNPLHDLKVCYFILNTHVIKHVIHCNIITKVEDQFNITPFSLLFLILFSPMLPPMWWNSLPTIFKAFQWSMIVNFIGSLTWLLFTLALLFSPLLSHFYGSKRHLAKGIAQSIEEEDDHVKGEQLH